MDTFWYGEPRSIWKMAVKTDSGMFIRLYNAGIVSISTDISFTENTIQSNCCLLVPVQILHQLCVLTIEI